MQKTFSILDIPLEGHKSTTLGKSISLINNHLDRTTGKPYDNLGAIYSDILTYIGDEEAVINHADDDDYYLPNHISSGVEGLLKSGKTAYKPKFSWFLTPEGISKIENVLEPSIFVKLSHLRKFGYHDNTINQHHKWIDGLQGDIEVDPNGISTFIYTWGNGTFKTSGNPHDILNFSRYASFSRDNGNGIINPCSKEEIQQYYNLTK